VSAKRRPWTGVFFVHNRTIVLFSRTALTAVLQFEEKHPMFKQKLIPAILAAMLLAAALSQTAGARGNDRAPEVQSCVAAITERPDLVGAERVRHFVNLTRSTGIGQIMEIDTYVYGAVPTRTYSSYCVANGSHEPLKFRISETTA
jgi:hypothetical protein